MNEIKLHEIYREGRELEMTLYLSNDEFTASTPEGITSELREFAEMEI